MSEERANEFLSRRRLRATESLEIFAKLKGELGGGELGGMTTPVDPLQPLFYPCFPVFLGVFRGVFCTDHPRPRDFKPKPPDQNDTSHTLRPSLCVRCRFYGFFGI